MNENKKIKAQIIVRDLKFKNLMATDKEGLVYMFMELEERYKKMEIDFHHLQNKIKRLEAEPETEQEKVEKKYAEYKSNWTLIEKVRFILKRNKKAMSITNIEQEICQIEPMIKFTLLDTYNSIANILSYAVKTKQIIRLKRLAGLKVGVYALPEWINENGNIQGKYQ